MKTASFQINQALGQVQRVHFIGIGGAGMSGIAAVLLSLHYQVTGSDLKASEVTDRLQKMGAKISFGHKAGNVSASDVVVYSAAVPMDNPEITEAARRGIPVIPRTEMLGELMRLKYGIAVSGTHGKTTTTSMVGLVLTEGGLDPTLVIGGQVDVFKSNAKLGKSPYLVAEACEAFGEFFLLSPMISIVTNIDDDHLDYYGSIEKVREAFVAFGNKVPFYGCVILGVDDKQVQAILPQLKRRAVAYGMGPGAALRARKVKLEKIGSTFEVEWEGKRLGAVKLNVPGRFNVQNALAAVAVGLELKVPFKAIAAGLVPFPWRPAPFRDQGYLQGSHGHRRLRPSSHGRAGDPEGGQELTRGRKSSWSCSSPISSPAPSCFGTSSARPSLTRTRWSFPPSIPRGRSPSPGSRERRWWRPSGKTATRTCNPSRTRARSWNT